MLEGAGGFDLNSPLHGSVQDACNIYCLRKLKCWEATGVLGIEKGQRGLGTDCELFLHGRQQRIIALEAMLTLCSTHSNCLMSVSRQAEGDGEKSESKMGH